jgi:hypothetical protein
MKTLYLTLELLVSRVSFCVVHIILYLNKNYRSYLVRYLVF